MRNLFLITLFILNFTSINAQKKDPQAWKNEETIEAQFSTLKKNASYWSEYYMFKEVQINEFQKSLSDSISVLEKNISTNKDEINELKKQIASLTSQYNNTQQKLEESLSKETSLTTLGIDFDKNSFPSLMYTIIIILTLIAITGFFLFFRSNILTKEAQKNHTAITEELANQKKRALERETKLNRELQTERNKNYK